MQKLYKYQKIELLAPAGNAQSLIMAVSCGADAVYLGLPNYSARKNVDNFDLPNLAYYIKYCHINNVKVYVAINTLIKDSELPLLLDIAGQVYNMGADAFIIQDVFLGKYLKQHLPNIEYHLSTQAGVCNVWGAKFAKSCGFDRVILARETPIEDIAQIAPIIQTEVFVHGALCTSFSGACLLSSVAGANSGNRGLCKQPCRKMYSLGDNKPNFAISPKDLCLARQIQQLVDVGVCSLKIEGRARSVEYVGASTCFYHQLLCGKWNDNYYQLLQRAFNRGFSQGLGLGVNSNFLTLTHSGHKGVLVGKVAQVSADRLTVDITKSELQFRNTNNLPNMSSKDGFKVVRQEQEVGTAIYSCCKGAKHFFKYNGNIKAGDSVYITKDSNILSLLPTPTKHAVDITIDFKVGQNAQIAAKCGKKSAKISGEVLESADTQPLNIEQIEQCFAKVEDYPFAPNINIEHLDNVFIGKKQINQLRRDIYQALFAQFATSNKRQCDSVPLPIRHFNNSTPFNVENQEKLSKCDLEKVENKGSFVNQTPTQATSITNQNIIIVIGNDFEQINGYDIAVYFPNNYCDIELVKKFVNQTQGKERFLYLPPLFTYADHLAIVNILSYFDGIYTDGYYGIEYSQFVGKKLILGNSCNIFNSIALDNLDRLPLRYVLSAELSIRQINDIQNTQSINYCLGSLAVMHYAYCPYGNKCSQSICADKQRLTDTEGRTFVLYRYKIGGKCRFALYNNVPTVMAVDGSKVINTITLTVEQTNALLHSNIDTQALKNTFPQRTKCHYEKGIN